MYHAAEEMALSEVDLDITGTSQPAGKATDRAGWPLASVL
jgi:hypothetical protein